MATLTNIARHSATLTNVSRGSEGGVIFYLWMFLFTIPAQVATGVANVARHDASLTNVAKH
jgi:hypothetical protein